MSRTCWRRARRPAPRGRTSLDAPIGGEDDATVGDLVGDVDIGFAHIDTALMAASLVATLPERERVIVTCASTTS